MPVNHTSVLATPTMEKGRQKRLLPSVDHMRDSFEATWPAGDYDESNVTYIID